MTSDSRTFPSQTHSLSESGPEAGSSSAKPKSVRLPTIKELHKGWSTDVIMVCDDASYRMTREKARLLADDIALMLRFVTIGFSPLDHRSASQNVLELEGVIADSNYGLKVYIDNHECFAMSMAVANELMRDLYQLTGGEPRIDPFDRIGGVSQESYQAN